MRPANVTDISRARRPKAQAQAAPAEITELDVSERFVRRFGAELRYCRALGGWFRWDGARWCRDASEHARECAKQTARDLAAEAAALFDDDKFKAAKRAGSAKGVDATLSLARSAPGIVFVAEDADSDPWLLNCQNGTLDLRTGTLQDHDRVDLITRVCPVNYDPQADAPMFRQFLNEVQPDPDVRAYLARLLGYAAVGVVREHVIGVFCGPGANGKSVLAESVSHALGDYAQPGPSSLIVESGSNHPTDVASCLGSRLVLVHETKRGAGFDASKIKLLTGGDKLTARYMARDFFSFFPSHTIVMLSNYRPQADATDAALWRRVQLVPFDVVIPVERRDRDLAEKLRGEAPGILRWLVEGALEWQRTGLAPPVVILDQTERYRASEDVIGAFLEERTVRLKGAQVKAGALYTAFKAWCQENGQRETGGKDFSAEITGRGFERVERNTGRIYLGIGLRADDSDDRGQS